MLAFITWTVLWSQISNLEIFFIIIIIFSDVFISILACNSCRPENFKSSNLDDSIENDGGGSSESLQGHTSQQEVKDEFESSDDDGLPPLEANMNRIKPFELQSDRESDSGSDTDWL